MEGWPRHLVVAILTPIIIFGLIKLLRRAKPAKFGPDGGVVRLAPGMSGLLLLGGVVFVALGIWGALWKTDGREPISGALIVLLGLACSMTGVLAISGRHDVVWNREGIEGPDTRFAVLLWFGRTAIRWTELVQLNVSGANYHFVETDDGRRVYWSTMTAGADALVEAIFENADRFRYDADEDDDDEPANWIDSDERPPRSQ